MKGIISQFGGWSIIVVYGLFMVGVTALLAKHFEKTKLYFLLAKRKVNWIPAGFSIAAAWVWAPALFIAAQKSYEQGAVGLFWFTAPNVLCLIVFAFFASKLRCLFPEGYTLSGYVQDRFSNRAQNMYLGTSLGLSTCSFAVQLLAGGTILASLTTIPFYQVTIALAIIAISYTFWKGINASIMTDFVDMAFMACIGLTFVPWAVINGGGYEAVVKGFGGISGDFTSLFDAKGIQVFLTFGLAATIGLMSGPFGDQSFWQRAFAIDDNKNGVKKAFFLGAFLFAIVPIMMSQLGFLAAGNGIKVNDAQIVNLEMVTKYLPFWSIVPFVYMLLMGLCSTLDSALSAVSSHGGHDLYNRMGATGDPIKFSRIFMVIVALLAICIANIPNMKILYMFLFYATMRSSTLLPTVTMILKQKNLSESGLFYGIIASLCIGLPIFAYGNFNKVTPMIVAGSLLTVFSSGIILWVTSKFKIGNLK
ncbi:MAG: hypothetical protein KA982_07050 [Clostridia bacterium]|nr:hypothetical protein [Clostridia bacterium]